MKHITTLIVFLITLQSTCLFAQDTSKKLNHEPAVTITPHVESELPQLIIMPDTKPKISNNTEATFHYNFEGTFQEDTNDPLQKNVVIGPVLREPFIQKKEKSKQETSAATKKKLQHNIP
ncbi:hypothetical protein [Marinirhabdus gelatinilytica]|uniref:YD repeat-containing protein n=1 Tax=Marinirhabdus gelatinilytica TaxID=1703343 RepID=A0A370Q7I3_9FLAO|nr:hypothetical protein [Marinirhabdus gelatinilytica]RDK84317.1 hypothetical protein C8D94_105163 [Marinirhabdus gelatinilytica]